MKKPCLLAAVLSALSLGGCGTNYSGAKEVELALGNFNRYVSYQLHDERAYGDVAAAWLVFKGVLSFAVYDVTVWYLVTLPSGSQTTYSIYLDASGSGVTPYYDFHSGFAIVDVLGTVNYRL